MNDRLNYLQVCRGALARNAGKIAEFVGTPVIGVLKCDGYGVGITEAAAAWRKAGVTAFAVSMPREAFALRDAGFTEEILLLAPVADPETLGQLAARNIILTVSDPDNARFYAAHTDAPLRVHAAVDTGMGRFGVRWSDTEALLALYQVKGLDFIGIFSHFSTAFEGEYSRTKLQLTRFQKALDTLSAAGIDPGLRHIANSCAALRFPETRLDAVRVGSALVGALPVRTPLELEPVVSFQAQVVARKTLEPGDTSGYAALCPVKRKTDAIVVAIGSDCGFCAASRPELLRPRDLLSWFRRLLREYRNPPCVQYQGKRLTLVGRVGTQYTLFDATGTDISSGEYVQARIPLLYHHEVRVYTD